MGAIEDLEYAIRKIRRTRSQIICPPNWTTQVRDRIAQEGLDGFVEVVESVHIPADEIYLYRGVTR